MAQDKLYKLFECKTSLTENVNLYLHLLVYAQWTRFLIVKAVYLLQVALTFQFGRYFFTPN